MGLRHLRLVHGQLSRATVDEPEATGDGLVFAEHLLGAEVDEIVDALEFVLVDAERARVHDDVGPYGGEVNAVRLLVDEAASHRGAFGHFVQNRRERPCDLGLSHTKGHPNAWQCASDHSAGALAGNLPLRELPRRVIRFRAEQQRRGRAKVFSGLTFAPARLPDEAEALRAEVRAFLADQMPADYWPNSDFNEGHSPEFTRRLGMRGWIGMTWPKAVGGGERTFFERYVVTEELLAAGAPVSAHWIADRQSGPLLLRFGTEEQQRRYLPGVARGETWFSIGMSEPNTGSDLASVATKAVRVKGGWRVSGTKIWTTDAHRNHYIIALVRTEGTPADRHAGLTQVIVDLKGEGVKVRPIANIAGGHDFNEVVFDECFV
ncbi:MAG: hypothetical protein F4Y01_10590, partial [Gammaproteobacteria bacterium]|nr:hypothetical protein [Gammaproteobacteria bacterium]